jgi:hypothetical protein
VEPCQLGPLGDREPTGLKTALTAAAIGSAWVLNDAISIYFADATLAALSWPGGMSRRRGIRAAPDPVSCKGTDSGRLF